MKSRIFAMAVTALLGLSTAVLADGQVAIGTNGDGPLSVTANVGWVRTGDYWSNIEKTPGVFNFDRAHEIANYALSHNQQVLFILSGSPTWCNGNDQNGGAPCDIESWKSFVNALSYEMRGQIAAYEIWNEPDLSNSGTYGVGWDVANFDAYPRYGDYVLEAARIIKANDSNAKVIAGAVSGKRSDTVRLAKIFQQLESTYYFDGTTYHPVSEYINGISGHMNLDDQTHSYEASYLYKTNVLDYISAYNPSNRDKEMWITEFGWHSNYSISEDSQRKRSKNFLIEMTGGGDHWLQGWKFTNGFLYVLQVCDNGGDGEQRSIFHCDFWNSPKLITSQYLQPLGFPAIQQPGVPTE